MATISETAKSYEAPSTKNIADLDEVTTDLDVKDDVWHDDEKNLDVPYKFIELNNDRYRVPVSVLKSLKAILAENPDLKKFKVKKTGEGLKTSYTVIPLS